VFSVRQWGIANTEDGGSALLYCDNILSRYHYVKTNMLTFSSAIAKIYLFILFVSVPMEFLVRTVLQPKQKRF